MPSLKEIQAPVDDYIHQFEGVFREAIKSRVSLLDIIMRYLTRRKGKQMRPLFVYLSADLCGGVTESSHRAAALIELLHTATLVHDDVVDISDERRGFFSINALWKNKVAVLAGDYLLSRGLLLAVENSELDILRIVSAATREMSEGELLQIEKARRLDIREDVYYEIIRKKTATLISSCCAAGASSAGASPDLIAMMSSFGEKVGMAFQIKDDLFDYQSVNNTGKPNGIDIRDQKMTLPLIFFLANCSSADKRFVINTVKNYNTDRKRIAKVIDMVVQAGGINYAKTRMHQYRDEALTMLDALPDRPSRQSLADLVRYTTDRDR
ncbi:MAG TPA: polyprenyl synthetase [Bacteroidales bacterium]|nr:MAG: polyprenyl synthetase [Bacteroidetes bacterium GWE2_42_24]OFY27789.1 MAG: polyprenyl synthetase [Bacteroidetes bacterium GWF2_43_11]HBZ66149.1 polyprenyl synthetase [Bacteroidales bacterium]